MAGYKILKPCLLAGVEYQVGAIAPAGAVLPEREGSLIRRGYLVRLDVPQPASPEVSATPIHEGITIHVGRDQDMTAVVLNEGSLQQFFDILQMTAEESVRFVQQIETVDILPLLVQADTRKTVRDAATKRMNQLVNKNQEEDRPDEEKTGDSEWTIPTTPKIS